MRTRVGSLAEEDKYPPPQTKIFLNCLKLGLVEGDTCVLRKAELGSGLE